MGFDAKDGAPKVAARAGARVDLAAKGDPSYRAGGGQASHSGEIWVDSTPRDSALSPKSAPHRATSKVVAGHAQLVIPDCIVRLEEAPAEEAVSEGLSVAPPPPLGAAVASTAQPESANAAGEDPESVPLPPRTRTYSAPAIAVEDHELEEVLDGDEDLLDDDDEEILDESHLQAEPPPTPPAQAATPPAPSTPEAPVQASLPPASPPPASLPPASPPPNPPALVVEEDTATELASGWHEDFFEHGEGLLVSCGGDAEAGHDVEFIQRCVSLHPGQRILDVGCGAGRHCFAFADLGFEVVGVDRSPRQLGQATERNRLRRQKVKFESGDMRSLRYGPNFDLVTCLGSTLGYFSDEVNRDCLVQMRDCLRPGGRLVLHAFSRDYVVANVPCRSWWSDDGALVLDEVDFDFSSEHLRVKRTMLSDSGRQSEHLIQIRAYGLRELREILQSIGLQVLEYSGSRGTRGYFYGRNSTDLWLVARKN